MCQVLTRFHSSMQFVLQGCARLPGFAKGAVDGLSMVLGPSIAASVRQFPGLDFR